MTFQHSSPRTTGFPHFSFNFSHARVKMLYMTMLPCSTTWQSPEKYGIKKVKDVFCRSCGVHAIRSSTQTQFPGIMLPWAWLCLVLIKCPQFLTQMSDGSDGVFVAILLVAVAPQLHLFFGFILLLFCRWKAVSFESEVCVSCKRENRAKKGWEFPGGVADGRGCYVVRDKSKSGCIFGPKTLPTSVFGWTCKLKSEFK